MLPPRPPALSAARHPAGGKHLHAAVTTGTPSRAPPGHGPDIADPSGPELGVVHSRDARRTPVHSRWELAPRQCPQAGTLASVDLDLPALQLRSRLRGAGYSDSEIRRLLRAGDLTTVRPGAYIAGPPPDAAAARHALRLRADVEHLADDAVASHVSAAVLHGLPAWGVSLERVHVSRDRRRSGGRVGRHVHVHIAPLQADEVVTIGGIAATSAARTVVDLARSVPFEQAVVVADAALARRLVSRAELDSALERATRWRGSPAARRTIAFADGRSESVGESRSRVVLRRADLPDPVPQWEVRAADGRLIGRVDFGWPGLATVGEFDGRLKYGRLLRPDQQPGDAVYAEKLREDELRSAGLGVARWTWADLDRFGPVADRLRRAFRMS